MARKRTFDHGLWVVDAGQSGCDRLTGTYPIVTPGDTATPYGQRRYGGHTPLNPGHPRMNVARKRTFDHGLGGTWGQVAAIVPFLALSAITYLATATVVGHRPDPADVELAFTAGPGVLLLSIVAGTEQWRRRAGAR